MTADILINQLDQLVLVGASDDGDELLGHDNLPKDIPH